MKAAHSPSTDNSDYLVWMVRNAQQFGDTWSEHHPESIRREIKRLKNLLFRADHEQYAAQSPFVSDCPGCGMPFRFPNAATASHPERLCDHCDKNSSETT